MALPVSLAETPIPPGTSRWVFHLPLRWGQCWREAGSGVWALAGLGVLVWAKLPIPSILASHAWGRQGQQTEHAKGVMGRAACSPALLHPVLCPPRLEPEWPTGLEASSCVQDENASKAPIFSTLKGERSPDVKLDSIWMALGRGPPSAAHPPLPFVLGRWGRHSTVSWRPHSWPWIRESLYGVLLVDRASWGLPELKVEGVA